MRLGDGSFFGELFGARGVKGESRPLVVEDAVFVVELSGIDVNHDVLDGGKLAFDDVVNFVSDPMRGVNVLVSVDGDFELDVDARAEFSRAEEVDVIDGRVRFDALFNLRFKLFVARDVDNA